jgi:LPS sulfotransferase NodH
MKTRQYQDASGKPCSLGWLVRNEPEWAANQIRHRDKLEDENTRLRKWIQSEGVRTDTCTYPVLGKICEGCRCSRRVDKQS